jgi:hypothetical protein
MGLELVNLNRMEKVLFQGRCDVVVILSGRKIVVEES